jgi:hypothetical protein
VICLIAVSAVAWRRIPRTPGGRRALATGIAIAAFGVGFSGLTVVTGWFWDAARFPLTAAGLDRYGALGPVPPALVVALTALVLVGAVVTIAAVARRPGPDGPDGSAPAA